MIQIILFFVPILKSKLLLTSQDENNVCSKNTMIGVLIIDANKKRTNFYLRQDQPVSKGQEQQHLIP